LQLKTRTDVVIMISYTSDATLAKTFQALDYKPPYDADNAALDQRR